MVKKNKMYKIRDYYGPFLDVFINLFPLEVQAHCPGHTPQLPGLSV